MNNLHDEQEENHWLCVSDLMSGLMILFLFISVAMMRSAFLERDKIKDFAAVYQQNQEAIFQELCDEFKDDLKKWHADIDKATLTFSFLARDALFENGEIKLSGTYQTLLSDYFPRYMRVLTPFKISINEIRIEGHTSSVWSRFSSDQEAYFKNMELSQGRTRSVLDYVYNIPSSEPYRPWIKANIAAVGLSSSKPILDKYGQEDETRSRRVSFRVITNSDLQIKRILGEKE